MIFKLVRVDSDNPIKIEIKPGTHVFGRGKLLAVDDKRISRKHGLLEVTENALVVTALHQNPCFYRRAGSLQINVLMKDESISLNSQDKLGLLSGSYWFEVLQCLDSDHDVSDHPSQTKTDCEDTDNENAESEPTQAVNDQTTQDISSVHTQLPNDIDTNLSSVETQVPNDISTDKDGNVERSEDAGKIDDGNKQSEEVDSHQNDLASTNNDATETNIDESESPSLLSRDDAAQSTSEASSPVKRPHDTNEGESSGEAKKVKTEADGETESKPGTSSDDNEVKPQIQPNTNPVILRERCMYGHSCYRRNAQHLAQFSHPRDGDWGAGPRAPCPRGAACGKRDPRHWRDHDHPPGTQQPPPNQPQYGRRVVHKNGNIFYINAQTVNFYDDHFEAEDSDGNSVDYDYEF